MADALSEVRAKAEHGRLVREMITQLEATLAGGRSREELEAWARERGSACWRWEAAASVFESLQRVTERGEGGEERVRELDLRACRSWLSLGECSTRSTSLLALEPGIDVVARRTGGRPVRCWLRGRGWSQELRFASPRSGRPFVARASADGASAVELLGRRSEPRLEAVTDLFETLAIDDRDVAWLEPTVELSRLPVWVLWRQDDNGNRFEVERWRSYAKAAARERVFDARGHRQTYWIEPAR